MGLRVVLAVVCLSTVNVAAHQGRATEAVALRALTISPDGRIVSIQASGPLRNPTAGRLVSPPRIYVDLPGVRPGRATTIPAMGPLVTRVRTGLNSADPLVTRVVIDLISVSAYRIDASAQESGLVAVILEDQPTSSARTSAAAMAPAERPGSAVTAAVTRRPRPAAPRATAGPSRYLQQVAPTLERLNALVPMLNAIEKLDLSATATDLQSGVAGFETVRRELAAINAPAAFAVQHDMLQRACILGARAARLRADALVTGDPSSGANASSAAAGVVMLITRATAELREAK